MKIKKMKSSLTGLVLLAASGAALVLYPDEQAARRAAFSGILIGLFLLFMSVNYRVPELVTGRVMESTTASICDVLDGLNVKGKGIFMPPAGNSPQDKVFIPLHEVHGDLDLKKIYDKSVFVTDDLSKNFGVLLRSPGGRLLDIVEKEGEMELLGIGAETLCETIKVMEGLDIVSSLDASVEGDDLYIVFSHSNYGENCSRIKDECPSICKMACCPVCSSILSAFARSEKRPLEILDVDRRDKVHIRARFTDI